jgi:hypothetical protein
LAVGLLSMITVCVAWIGEWACQDEGYGSIRADRSRSF